MKHTDNGHAFTEIVVESFKLTGLLTTEGDRLSAPLGLSSARWKILGALARSESPLTVSQIARTMGQSRQAVQTLVNAMSGAGLVSFQDNPNHRRAKLVVLSTDGQDRYRRMEELQIPWANHCSAELSIDDLAVTLRTLKSLSSMLIE